MTSTARTTSVINSCMEVGDDRQQFVSTFFKNIADYRDYHFLCDICIHLHTEDSSNDDQVYAHKLVLAAASPFFRELFLLKRGECDPRLPIQTVDLNLPSSNSIACFKALINYLYSGELSIAQLEPVEVMQVARLCQLGAVEARLQAEMAMKDAADVVRRPGFNALKSLLHKEWSQLSQSLLRADASGDAAATSVLPSYLSTLLPVYLSAAAAASQQVAYTSRFPLPLVSAAAAAASAHSQSAFTHIITPSQSSAILKHPLSPTLPTGFAGKSNRQHQQQHVATADIDVRPPPATATTPGGENPNELIVPSNDKEGWCRNKKYIERVPNGFMCTVCRKTYGRYNSVSYHVTIYHRNPPIRCDEDGCQFTTREARYIHFHKYYRHNVSLPESIDLGSRKCPFCRHVSKSPAMLEKHINRHLPDSSRTGRALKCPTCGLELQSQKAMYDHISMHQEITFPCDQCSYRGTSEVGLSQHRLFKHSQDMFKKKLQCDDCNFTCASDEGLVAHCDRMHRPDCHSDDESVDVDIASTSSSTSTMGDVCIKQQQPASMHFQSSLIADYGPVANEPMCLIVRRRDSRFTATTTTSEETHYACSSSSDDQVTSNESSLLPSKDEEEMMCDD